MIVFSSGKSWTSTLLRVTERNLFFILDNWSPPISHQIEKFHEFLPITLSRTTIKKKLYTTQLNYVDAYSICRNFESEYPQRKHFCGISSGNISRLSNVVVFLFEILHFSFTCGRRKSWENWLSEKTPLLSGNVSAGKSGNEQVIMLCRGALRSPILLTDET